MHTTVDSTTVERNDVSSCKQMTYRADQRAAELNAKQKRKNDFNSTYGQLGVTNDAEIDAKLNELEYKQQHESLSIQEEKLIIKQIKQLQASMATCMHPCLTQALGIQISSFVRQAIKFYDTLHLRCPNPYRRP